ncbi:chloride channel [Entophlyctis helioformis]|nr:chloride channel [Entophlyctis helioformis]
MSTYATDDLISLVAGSGDIDNDNDNGKDNRSAAGRSTAHDGASSHASTAAQPHDSFSGLPAPRPRNPWASDSPVRAPDGAAQRLSLRDDALFANLSLPSPTTTAGSTWRGATGHRGASVDDSGDRNAGLFGRLLRHDGPGGSGGSPHRRASPARDDDFGQASSSAGWRVAYTDFTTIDWIHDSNKERSRVRNLRKLAGTWGAFVRAWDASQTWILILIIGGITGLLAGFIDVSEQWLSDMRMGYCSAGFYLNRQFCCWLARDQCEDWVTWSSFSGVFWPWGFEYLTYIATAVAFAVASAVLVETYAPYAAGSGIPEVKTILGGFIIRKFLGVWTLLIKCIGLVLAVASGLALGKEGPLVHVACSVGYIFPRFFRKYAINEAKKREMLSAACAAGVSVAFGAPIGGVLFSLEEVSYYFPYKTMWRSFFMAMIAAISLQLVNPFRTGKLVLFQITFRREWHGFELPFFILLGALGGLYGSLFIRLNVWYASYRKTGWLKNWPISEVACVALVTAVCSFPFQFLRENTAELVANLFRECSEIDGDFHGLCNESQMGLVIASLLFAATIKIIMTIMTFGVRVPAGIFIPSMAIGACVGRALGIVIQAWQRAMPDLWLFSSCEGGTQCVTPGTYAMVGAAASLAGVTRMSVSLTVIMFELTGALSYVLPIMITILVAKWVADVHGKEGIYECLIRLNGYPFLSANEEYTHSTAAAHVMTRLEDMEYVSATGHTIDSLDDLLRTTKCKGFPVVLPHRLQTIGYIGREELKFAIESAKQQANTSGTTLAILTDDPALDLDVSSAVDFRPWIDQTPFMVHPRFQVDMLVELFKKMGLRYSLVTRNGQLLGIITKKDILRDMFIRERIPRPSRMNGAAATYMNSSYGPWNRSTG